MNPRETVWRPLVERRLLPVAILLIAALVAVPLLLAKDPEPVAPVASAPAAGAAEAPGSATAQPIVSLVGDEEETTRRRVLGAKKNPFTPGPAPKAEATAQGTTVTTGVQSGGRPADTGSSVTTTTTGGGGGTTPAGGDSGPAPADPVAGPPSPPAPKLELYSLTVRFGSSEGESLEKMNLARLKPLPSAEDAFLVYLGVGKDEKTAIFMVDASVEPQGDGVCRPNPANCETIHLRKGDTEFFDVQDETGKTTGQFQLDLLDIKRSTTSSSAKAAAVRAKVSPAGRKLLRARQAAQGPLRYRYDARDGVVERLQKKAFKAAVARATKAVTAVFEPQP